MTRNKPLDLAVASPGEIINSPGFGKRHVQVLLLSSILTISYGARVILSVAILAMTKKNSTNPDIPTYPEWKNTDTILSSFFWGYFIPQIIAGQASEKFGPKWFLFTTAIISAIANGLTPLVASQFGSTGVMTCRVIMGLNDGFLFPSMYHLLSKWVPLPERSRATNFCNSGSPLGIVIGMPLAGTISDSSWGWPAVFYLYCGLAISWALIWAYVGCDGPEKHSTISIEEKKYLETYRVRTIEESVKNKTPWKAIFMSLPVWAMLIGEDGHAWGTLITELPSYLGEAMGFEMTSGSLLSALPYMGSWAVNLACGPIADKIITGGFLSITWTRKWFQIIGSVTPALALMWLAFLDKSQRNLAVGLILLIVASQSIHFTGTLTNQMDLAPNFSGTLTGLTNFTAQIFSFIGPLVVGLLGSDKSQLLMWKKVYLLSAGIMLATCAFYVCFGSGEIQPWNYSEPESNEENDQNTAETV